MGTGSVIVCGSSDQHPGFRVVVLVPDQTQYSRPRAAIGFQPVENQEIQTMEKRGSIVLLLDTAGFIALTVTGVGLFSLEFGRITMAGDHLIALCVMGLCIAVTALLVARIIEIIVYTVAREGAPLRGANGRSALSALDGVRVEP
ncbi:MAG: hypothetical protein ACU85U_19020 [Gammaproteobacteria bacterium]